MSSSTLLLLYLLVCGNVYLWCVASTLQVRNKRILLILISALPFAYVPVIMNWSFAPEWQELLGLSADEFIAYVLSIACLSLFHFFVRRKIAKRRVWLRRLNLAIYCFAVTIIAFSVATKYGLFDSLLLNDFLIMLLQGVPAILVVIYLIYLAVILRLGMPQRKGVHK